MAEHSQGPQSQRDWQAIGAASGIGCTVVVSLMLCIGGGILLDRWLGIEPFGVLVGVGLGFFAVGYAFYELAVMGDPQRGIVKLSKKSGDDNEIRSRR